jgi:hypothetical protein
MSESIDSGNKVLNFSSMILGSDIKENNFSINKSPEIKSGFFDSFSQQATANKFKSYLLQIKTDEQQISDIIMYASLLFDLKEYKKCNHVLIKCINPKYPTAMFLFYFSEYLMVQQRKQEEYMDNAETGYKHSNNKDLYKLYQSLKLHEQKEELSSPFIIYLYGVILKEMNLLEEAHTALLRSLQLFPFLWSAWIELTIISKKNDLMVYI